MRLEIGGMDRQRRTTACRRLMDTPAIGLVVFVHPAIDAELQPAVVLRRDGSEM